MTQQYTIIHLADVHFRGLSRHDEYVRVFNSFFEKARQIRPDTIYIGGDIFHTKTQNISPEVVGLIGWWLTELANIADVVVTLGNHDGNLMNRDREDAITPIVNLLDNDRIKLYKKSGVYPAVVDGYNWCIFSCFDEDGWKDVKPVKDNINIASFHGSVLGSTTESNFELEGEVDVNFFRQFDFGLLGDIHKMQFLSRRKCIDGVERPWLGYCGSTIQQNYAEDPEHGFLVWKIRSSDDFDVEFIALENENMFVTLDWNGDMQQLFEDARKVPSGARFRIRSGVTIPQAEWRSMSKELTRQFNAIEVVPKVDTVNEITAVRTGIIRELATDLRDVSVHMRLLHEYLVNENISDDTWKSMEDLITAYITEFASEDDVARNVRWSLDRLEFSNTFAYGDDNVIDFTSLNGITGIFAANAMGKSSIIGTMMYALYNATDRGPMKNLHVINIRKQYCEAIAHLSIDGKRHQIHRFSKKNQLKNGEVTSTTKLEYTAPEENENLNDIQRRDTEKVIRRTIGTAEDFMLTSLAVQGGLKSFISEGATQRKAILSRFLDLNIFDKINEKLKYESLSLKSRIKDMPERNWDGERIRLQDSLNVCNEELSQTDNTLNEARRQLQLKQAKLAEYKDSHVITQADIDLQRAEITYLAQRITELNATKREVLLSMQVTTHQLQLISNVKNNFPIDSYVEKKNKHRDLLKWMSEVETELGSMTRERDRKNKSILKLAEVPCGDSYPQCKYIKDSHADREELPRLEAVITKISNEISSKKMLVDSFANDGYLKKMKRYDRIIAREQGIQLKAMKFQHQQENVDRQLSDLHQALKAEGIKLDDMMSKFDASIVPTDDPRDMLKQEILTLEGTMRDLDNRRMMLAQQLGRLTESLRRLADEKLEYEQLAARWTTYEYLIKSTAQKGIPSQLLRHMVPMINDEIARILNGIAQFTIELELPDGTNSMEVYINYGDSRRIIELGSGMEKMMASIAIRVALINISSLPKTDMLIIDEGFSELDESNIDACGQLLRSLTRWFKNIIIITHIDTLKDVVDNVIDITRIGRDAKVCYA